MRITCALLAVLAILAIQACSGGASSPLSPSGASPAPPTGSQQQIIVVTPGTRAASESPHSTTVNYHHYLRMGGESEYTVSGGPDAEWSIQPGYALAYGGMEFDRTGDNKFRVRLVPFTSNAGDRTRFVTITRGGERANLILYEAN